MTAKTMMGATFALTLLATAGAMAGDKGMKGHDMFGNADANNDGAVTEAEMTAALRAHFDQFDTNKDGKIVLSELPQEMPMPEGMAEKMAERKARMVEKVGQEKADKMAEKMKERKAPTRMDFIARHDANGDEAVTFEEFAKRPLKHFKKADENGDGTVTAAEKEAAMAKMRERMKDRDHRGPGKMRDQRGPGPDDMDDGEDDQG